MLSSITRLYLSEWSSFSSTGIHLVPKHASDLIDKEMKESGEWTVPGPDYRSNVLGIRERDHFNIKLREGLRTTINQPAMKLQFNSRRWQGYQVDACDSALCYFYHN